MAPRKRPNKAKKGAKPAKVAAGETTPQKTPNAGLKPPWKPGQSGNPNGRPLGSRNKLCKTFIEDLQMVWGMAALQDAEGIENLTKGQQALLTIALARPTALVKAVGDLVPREFDMGDKTQAGFRQLLEAMQTGKFKPRPYNPHEDDDA